MTADIINLLNMAKQKIKELAADRDSCLDRAKRAEERRVSEKAEHERELSRVKNERDKLLKVIERRG